MSEYDFFVMDYRFHINSQNKLVLIGWFRENNPQHRQIEVYLDHTRLDMTEDIRRGSQVRVKYAQLHADVSEEILCTVSLPDNWQEAHKLYIYSVLDGKKAVSERISVRRLQQCMQGVEHYIESIKRQEGNVHITGWAIAKDVVDITVSGKNGVLEEVTVERKYRRDVQELHAESNRDYKAGFEVMLPDTGDNRVTLTFQAEDKLSRENINIRRLLRSASGARSVSIWTKVVYNLRKNGFKATLEKCVRRLLHPSDKVSYEKWRMKHMPKPEELNRQRQEQFAYQPLFSIVVPLYKTKERFLRELLETVQGQTYANWELCLADGSGEEDSLQPLIAEYQKSDSRIKYQLLERNEGIAGNTNAALQMAAGEYVVLADHDDLLSYDALYECVHVLNENRAIDVIYSDEDKVDMTSKEFFDPHFKSDMNIDLLCSMNYICHLFVFRRTLLGSCGLFCSEYDGAQDHDFILRCVEKAKAVYHIPKILYHWRCHRDSTAENPESKLYAFENGCKAIEAHYKRIGVPATVEQGEYYGLYRTFYHWKEQPLISIIIPNKDHVDDLRMCVESIEQKSSYRNYEFIIVENNSTQEETFAYYETLKEKGNVTVVQYEGGFNFSRINNYGATFAKGGYLLLLNNDTEIRNADCLKEMLDYCMREDVGIVGARLFYEDNTIQHAGVVIGLGGAAGHTFVGEPEDANGYFSRIICAQDYSAVTAACMMVKKSVYEAVGGLTETYEVAFNDIDFCLKVRELGKLVVYNPYAMLTHYESKSRGLEDSPEKIDRFNSEVERLQTTWEEIMEHGDPYYNPNLSLDFNDFRLKM